MVCEAQLAAEHTVSVFWNDL